MKRNLERLSRLTPREREVLHEVGRGRLNKQVAFDLGISEVTVRLHRGNVMHKMEAARACQRKAAVRYPLEAPPRQFDSACGPGSAFWRELNER